MLLGPQWTTGHGSDPRRALGRLGEDLAAAHLRTSGFSLIARNHRTREGEIDLVVFDGQTLAFVEVKTRQVSARGRGVRPDQAPLEGLHRRQQLRLRRLAVAWLAEKGRPRPTARTIRFDAIGVIVDTAGRLVRLDHVEDAW